jgi:hypothetical protein
VVTQGSNLRTAMLGSRLKASEQTTMFRIRKFLGLPDPHQGTFGSRTFYHQTKIVRKS